MAQINKSSEYFNTVLYAGNNSTQSITGVNFQPDLVYIKGRNTSLKYPTMFDSVRGATKRLTTFSNNAEDTHPTMLSSFDSDGWTSGSDDQTNASGTNYVCWNWLAGGTGVSNTDGSITSTVSANTTSGFSIVSYTGTNASATVGHGLGAVPKVIIVKCRTTVDNWAVYTAMTGNTSKLRLNGSNATITGVSSWDSTTPTSSFFSLGADTEVNNTSATIAYCFAEKKGFSKFGSYTGNGSTDGTFVYTGFKPAWVMVKASNGVYHWKMYDNKRDIDNPVDKELSANLSDAEADSTRYIDFLSNGFKLRHSNSNGNGSGVSYIYMAFAENPLVGTNNIPTTAR